MILSNINLEKYLSTYFGYTKFIQGQKDVIERLLQGESTAAIFITGGGKSLCYQLPALLLPGITLVISPLLSLMKDQLDYLRSRNISSARLDSTLNREEYNKVLLEAKSGKLKILMISVERKKMSDVAITKYLCGINSPIFTKNRLTKNDKFGIFENYRFQEVKNWVSEHSNPSVMRGIFK